MVCRGVKFFNCNFLYEKSYIFKITAFILNVAVVILKIMTVMLRYSQNYNFFVLLFTVKPLMMAAIFIHGWNQNFLLLTEPLCKKKKKRNPKEAVYRNA